MTSERRCSRWGQSGEGGDAAKGVPGLREDLTIGGAVWLHRDVGKLIGLKESKPEA